MMKTLISLFANLYQGIRKNMKNEFAFCKRYTFEEFCEAISKTEADLKSENKILKNVIILQEESIKILKRQVDTLQSLRSKK
jgi:hypothetical protein